MLQEAARFTWAGERGYKRLLTGGGLLVIAFGILPLWVVLGYVARFAAEVAAGRDQTPPPFDHWGELMSDGLRVFIIHAVYLLVPVSTLFAGGFILVIAPVNPDVNPVAGWRLVAIGAVTLSIAAYLIPGAVVRYAVEQRLVVAFSPSRMNELWFSGSYLRSWGLSVGVLIGLHLIALLLTLTVLGILLIPSLLFFSYLVSAYVLVKGTRDMLMPDRVGTA